MRSAHAPPVHSAATSQSQQRPKACTSPATALYFPSKRTTTAATTNSRNNFSHPSHRRSTIINSLEANSGRTQAAVKGRRGESSNAQQSTAFALCSPVSARLCTAAVGYSVPFETDDDSHARTTWFDVGDDASETAERHDTLGSFWGLPALGLWPLEAGRSQARHRLPTGTPGRRAAARGPWRGARPRLVRTNRTATANCDGQTEAHRARTTKNG